MLVAQIFVVQRTEGFLAFLNWVFYSISKLIIDQIAVIQHMRLVFLKIQVLNQLVLKISDKLTIVFHINTTCILANLFFLFGLPVGRREFITRYLTIAII